MTLTKDQIAEALKSKGRNTFMTDEMKELINEMVADGYKVKDIAAAINSDSRFEIKAPKQTYNRVYNHLSKLLKQQSK